jgi:hypothetical protein
MDLPPKPEPDRCDGHGALEDIDTVVEPRGHGPEVEGVDRPLDFVSALADVPEREKSLDPPDRP